MPRCPSCGAYNRAYPDEQAFSYCAYCLYDENDYQLEAEIEELEGWLDEGLRADSARATVSALNRLRGLR